MTDAPLLPLQQHPHYAAALARLGCTTGQVALKGAAPVQTIRRFGLTCAMRGPIWHGPPDLNGADALRRSGLRVVNSDGHDRATLRAAGFVQAHTPAYVAELCLSGAPQDRRARMRGKWRNSLRRAEAAPFRIQRELYNSARHQWLLDADLRQQRAKGFRSLPHVVLNAFAAVHPKDVSVFVARAGDDPIAAMLFLTHGGVATYHLGWTGAMGRANGAHNALLARAADHLARRGVHRLDLGTVDTVNAPGLARFKIGTGATVRPLGGTWVRVPWL